MPSGHGLGAAGAGSARARLEARKLRRVISPSIDEVTATALKRLTLEPAQDGSRYGACCEIQLGDAQYSASAVKYEQSHRN
jgi:hypothetical protein